ncbi:MAG: GNAT family N-acetyltransferase [Actinobacteria bacterium]|nr:GNAT family N-acetyltransferase [Actinomycetota bacterium]
MTAGPHDEPTQPNGAGLVELVERPLNHPDAVVLLRAFRAEQLDRYGFADPIDVHRDDYVSPTGAFVVVYRDGQPVGCGGYRWFDHTTRTVEIKKTYVVPEARGIGHGCMLLAWLENHAVTAGAQQAILETGVRNKAALHMFAAAGYRPTERYVDGRDPLINRAFTKPLDQFA